MEAKWHTDIEGHLAKTLYFINCPLHQNTNLADAFIQSFIQFCEEVVDCQMLTKNLK